MNYLPEKIIEQLTNHLAIEAIKFLEENFVGFEERIAQSEAARILGISPGNMPKYIKRYNLSTFYPHNCLRQSEIDALKVDLDKRRRKKKSNL